MEAAGTGELTVENGLVMRQVPNIRKLQFEPDTEDFMVYKRRKTQNESVTVEENYKSQLKWQQVLEEARSKITRQQSSSNLSGIGNRSSNGSMRCDRAEDEEGSQRVLSDSPRDAVIEDEPPQSLPEEAA